MAESSGIEITRDLKTIREELRTTESQIKSAAKEASSLQKAMKLDPSNTKLSEANYKQLEKQFEACTKKIELLKEQQQILVSKNGPEVTLTPQYEKLENEIVKTETQAKSLQTQLEKTNTTDFTKLTNSLKTVSKVCAAVIASIAAIGVAYASSADEIQKMVDKYGGTAEEWQYASNQWDKLTGDADAYASVLSSVVTVQGQVQKESSKVGTVLEQLGLAFEDVQGKSTTEALEIYLEALSQVESEAERQSIAVALFGESVGTYMAKMASASAESLQKYNEALEEAGVLTNEEVENGAALQDTLDYLKQTLTKLVAQMGSSLKPMIESIVSILQSVAPLLGTIADAFNAIPAPVQVAIVAFTALMTMLPGLISLLGALHVATGNIAMGALVFTTLAAVAGISAGVVSALTSGSSDSSSSGYELGEYQSSDLTSATEALASTTTEYSTSSTTDNSVSSSTTTNNNSYNINISATVTEEADVDEIIQEISDRVRTIGG